MTPFAVRVALASPVAPGQRLTLDAVLSGLVFRETGDPARAAEALPLARTHGVWHASAAVFESPAESPVQGEAHWETMAITRGLRLERETGSAPIEFGRRGERIDRTTGPFRNLKHVIRVIHAPALWFSGVGDAGAVKALLRRAPGIGKRANSGFGAVADVDVASEGLPADRAGIADADGFPLRPVPVGLWARFGGRAAKECVQATETWQVPYWLTERAEVCVVPPDLARVQRAERIMARFGLVP